jgi:membrane-associated phospholipid phosphatase
LADVGTRDHGAQWYDLVEPEDEMNIRTRSYTTYSIAVGIVWAVILVVTSVAASAAKFHTILVVFGGFVIGWLSATIARYVYPPPKKYRQDSGQAS